MYKKYLYYRDTANIENIGFVGNRVEGTILQSKTETDRQRERKREIESKRRERKKESKRKRYM